MSSLSGKALYRKGCYECEEEVWEEVPCDDIPSNITTVSPLYHTSKPTYKSATANPAPTTNKPTTATPKPKPYPTAPSSSPPPIILQTTTMSPDLTTLKDPFKKCYCECKLGCKEFCRKVVVNSPDQQIVQVSKISVPVEKGHIESTHYLQRELIPKSDQAYKNDDNYVPSHNNDEPENEKYATPPSLPVPTVSNYEEDRPINSVAYAAYHSKPNLPTISYHSKQIAEPIEPIYHSPYATAEAGVNNMHSYATYPPKPPHTAHYNAPSSDSYDFPIPFENVYTKVSKTLLNPKEKVEISLKSKIGNPTYSKCPQYPTSLYSSPTPVKVSQLETRTSLDNALHFDDSFDSLIKEFLDNNPSNEAYQAYPKPFYSVSYSR